MNKCFYWLANLIVKKNVCHSKYFIFVDYNRSQNGVWVILSGCKSSQPVKFTCNITQRHMGVIMSE